MYSFSALLTVAHILSVCVLCASECSHRGRPTAIAEAAAVEVEAAVVLSDSQRQASTEVCLCAHTELGGRSLQLASLSQGACSHREYYDHH
jgi:hypothetical protein